MLDVIQVVTTTANQADARRIAEELVKRRLAACVQISGPIESWYWWQGTIEAANEWRCTIKTRKSLYSRVESTILELHPYEQPQIVAVACFAGSQSYLQWLFDETLDNTSE